LALVFATSTALASVDPATDPNGWLQALDRATIAENVWSVGNLRIDIGRARLDIEKGTLVPVRGPAARTHEFLFMGKARFVLATDDPVESYQLELFTQRDQLDEPVTRAVLAIASDTVADSLSSRAGAAAATTEASKEAAGLLAAWRGSREYRRGGFRLLALADAIGDPDAQHFAAAWIDTPRLGRFLLRVDPYVPKSMGIEQFVPIRLGDLDKEGWVKWLRSEQLDGRRLNVDPEDLGTWDTWYQEAVGADGGGHVAGRSAFEPEHYELGTRIDDDISSVVGRAQIDLASRSAGARVIQIELFPDLTVDSISLRGGAALPWARSANQIVAVLPAATTAGSKVAIDVRYHGILFERNEDKLIVKRTTTGWYPQVGSVNRATYRAVFETPGSWTLLGSGRKIEDAKDGHLHRQVRELDKPSAFFGFEIGKFKVVERPLGHIALTIGFLSDLRTASEAEREATIDTIGKALATYETRFGPYPLDYLNVATTRHEFAQGFLGFVTLWDDLVQDVDTDHPGTLNKRSVIAHELAHQWWGNVVGWASDDDVWLSESLANYAAAVFRHSIVKDARSASESMRLDRVQTLDMMTSTPLGRPIEAMGPITMGPRLDSSLSDDAFQAIVYNKGGKVLAMLADHLGEDQFLAMLKEIAQRANFRPFDTATIIGALGKMSGRDLNGFARSFVNGVGYPEIHYTYSVAPREGGFVLSGTVGQVSRGFRRDKLVQVESGKFDVTATYMEYQPVKDATVLIPALISVTAFEGAEPRGLKTMLKVSGAETPFTLNVPQKPKDLFLDSRTTLPTSTINATREPRAALIYRANALRSTGRLQEARAAYEQALLLPADVKPDDETVRPADVARRTKFGNAYVRLGLADLAIDDGRFDDAQAALADPGVAAIQSGTAGAFEIKALRARIAMHSGDAASAYKHLNGTLALDVLQKETDTGFDAIRKHKLNSGWSGSARDYLVYAAAAHATGHEDVCREASAEARRHGGDPSVLEELHASAH
jgi:hypothetical protein